MALGALLGAVGSVAGGLISSRNNAAATAAANRAQIAANKDINRQNRKLQMKTNKNQIQWLVEDARKAGIHPLAALGSSIAGNIAAPVMSAPTIQARNGDAVGAGIASGAAILGQGIDTWLARQHTALQNEALMLQNAQSRSLLANARAETIKAFGEEFRRDPSRFSKASDAQDEFGEFVGDAVGGAAFLDAAKNKVRAWADANPPQDVLMRAIQYALSQYASQLVPHSNHPKGK